MSLGEQCLVDAGSSTILDDTVTGVDVGESGAPHASGNTVGGVHGTNLEVFAILRGGEVGILEVAVCRLCEGVLVGTCLTGVQPVAVAIEIAQVGIE